MCEAVVTHSVGIAADSKLDGYGFDFYSYE